MRIAVISDSHLGYGPGERERDAMDSFREALERALDHDLILLPGDIFDTKVPTPEVMSEAMRILNMPKASEGAALVDGFSKDMENVPHLTKRGLPVVSIHGTHERRIKGLVNPLQALEKAGFLVHLHCNGVVLEKEGERVCIQGLSGVPDQYAESVLSEWGPSPKDGCFNIFMLHQSIAGHVNATHVLHPDRLPKGFDLYICGHMHEDKVSEAQGKPFLIPGSLIQTQLTKESPKRRGFYSLLVEGGSLLEMKKVELEGQRPVHYLELDPDRELIDKEVSAIASGKHAKKPLVRVRLKGEMDSAATRELEGKFADSVILSFRKEPSKAGAPAAKGLEEQRLSVQELGRKLLQENLKKAGLDPRKYESVFEALMDSGTQEALELLRKPPNNKYGQEENQEANQEGPKEEARQEEGAQKGQEEGKTGQEKSQASQARQQESQGQEAEACF